MWPLRERDLSGPPVLGIVVDEEQDEELARLFAIREELEDDAFLAQWELSSHTASRVLLDPRGPRAVWRYTIGIERPERLERQFLFLVHVLAPRLAELQQPGTSLALIPQRIVEGNLGRTASAYDVLSYCLPVGEVEEPSRGLDEALAHVHNGGSSPAVGPNRAQRRAQRRKERRR